jgi:hypothetical protein
VVVLSGAGGVISESVWTGARLWLLSFAKPATSRAKATRPACCGAASSDCFHVPVTVTPPGCASSSTPVEGPTGAPEASRGGGCGSPMRRSATRYRLTSSTIDWRTTMVGAVSRMFVLSGSRGALRTKIWTGLPSTTRERVVQARASSSCGVQRRWWSRAAP